MDFKGVITPMVTPFDENEDLDWELLGTHVDYLLDNGVHALAPAGSTGEFEALTFDEVVGVYETVADRAAGRVPVIGGMGGRGTREAVAMARAAEAAGLDGLLVLPPYYYGFNEDEIFNYYRDVAEATDLLIMLYNNPGKTKVDVLPEMVRRLSEIPNIRYIKESSADVRRIRDIIEATEGEIVVIGGWDSIFLESLLMGAKGMVSGTSNVVPEAMVKLYELAEREDYAGALEYYERVRPFLALMEDRGRLAAWVKTGMRLCGANGGYPRRPYAPISDDEVDSIRAGLNAAGIDMVREAV